MAADPSGEAVARAALSCGVHAAASVQCAVATESACHGGSAVSQRGGGVAGLVSGSSLAGGGAGHDGDAGNLGRPAALPSASALFGDRWWADTGR
jgi:hypothetical protein